MVAGFSIDSHNEEDLQDCRFRDGMHLSYLVYFYNICHTGIAMMTNHKRCLASADKETREEVARKGGEAPYFC